MTATVCAGTPLYVGQEYTCNGAPRRKPSTIYRTSVPEDLSGEAQPRVSQRSLSSRLSSWPVHPQACGRTELESVPPPYLGSFLGCCGEAVACRRTVRFSYEVSSSTSGLSTSCHLVKQLSWPGRCGCWAAGAVAAVASTEASPQWRDSMLALASPLGSWQPPHPRCHTRRPPLSTRPGQVNPSPRSTGRSSNGQPARWGGGGPASHEGRLGSGRVLAN
eukprot:scaffold441_cov382-Prasinococcus_capsulatus_cf.AAC.1